MSWLVRLLSPVGYVLCEWFVSDMRVSDHEWPPRADGGDTGDDGFTGTQHALYGGVWQVQSCSGTSVRNISCDCWTAELLMSGLEWEEKRQGSGRDDEIRSGQVNE